MRIALLAACVSFAAGIPFVARGKMLELKPEIITALAALFGSLVGAFGTLVSNWLVQRHQDRRVMLEKKIVSREALYSDFIHETARVLVDAAQHNVSDAQALIPAYALVSRIRLSSSPEVLKAAEDVVRHIIEVYSLPNLTVQQIQSIAVSGQDPLRGFSEICRAELEGLQNQA